ncbi:MAG: TIGR03435 family protein [Bryobacteraceae bacterium]
MQRFLPGLMLWALTAFAQTPATFDAASIKPHPAGDPASRVSSEDHGVRATNVTLLRLITLAYEVTEAQTADWPAWLNQDRWDIQAKSLDLPEKPTPEQVIPMMKALLAERMGLKVHREPRPQQVYRLTVDRGGMKGTRSAEQKQGGTNTTANATNIRMKSQGVRMDEFARNLARMLARPVLDRTGLDGFFDFELSWVPDLAVPAEGDTAGATIFTAIREQMGLRLDAAKEPVEVLVIDAVSRPSDN